MQKFGYRYPRYPVDLPARLSSQGAILSGRCKDISHDGMRFESVEPLAPNARGTITFSFQGSSLELTVRVAHASNGGLEFLYESDSERKAVQQIVAFLASPRSRSTLTLVK
jgi:hypothetical protein